MPQVRGRANPPGGSVGGNKPAARKVKSKKERSPTPDWGVSDDEDVIMVDSD